MDQMWCEEVSDARADIILGSPAWKWLLSIAKPLPPSLQLAMLFKRSLERSLGKCWEASLHHANMSVSCRDEVKSISTRLTCCWSLLSVLLLQNCFFLSCCQPLPLMALEGNIVVTSCDREARQSERMRLVLSDV